MGLRMIFFFKHFPKIFALSYVFVGISFWLVSSQLFPYWWFWLLLLGVLYGIKDYYLEGYAILEKSELENY
ncbi:MAG: hypothetical protein RMH75_07035, partial [Archaeoglobaceae archaeon]|nr:hypothetical protein [Archaeoglobaceae archaeon]